MSKWWQNFVFWVNWHWKEWRLQYIYVHSIRDQRAVICFRRVSESDNVLNKLFSESVSVIDVCSLYCAVKDRELLRITDFLYSYVYRVLNHITQTDIYIYITVQYSAVFTKPSVNIWLISQFNSEFDSTLLSWLYKV